MTIAVALLLGAALVAAVAPWLLRRLTRFVDPVALLVGWAVAVLAVAVTAGAGLAAMTVPLYAADSPLSRFVGGRLWAAVATAPQYLLYQLADTFALVVAAAAVARLVWSALRVGLARRRRVAEHLAVLRVLGDVEPGGPGEPPTLWLRSARPLAFSLGGRPGAVVATDGLRAQLTPDALAAVLAHERAHLRGRHHMVVACADVLAAAFPFVPLLRAAPGAVRELVELVADADAAGASGPDALRAALLRVTGAGAPDVALAIGRTAVELRLRVLARRRRPPSLAGRISRCGSLGMVAACTPLAVTVGLLWTASRVAGVLG
ncbi:hypothetical protein BJF78_12665 [Pseudonocardia sp. CNS-139]|nr:hypothetical protein BJF78_12665 [Pseudonocardia sp. CNS-139]